MSPVSNAVLTQRNWRWRKNENVNASNVHSVSCSVCSVLNPFKTPRERDLGRKRCATLQISCGDDRHSENTLPCSASAVRYRLYTVLYVKQRCSSSNAGQLMDATTKMRVGCNTVDRVSTLLIRWSWVRVPPTPPPRFSSAPPLHTVSQRQCRCICRRIQLADADCVVATLCSTRCSPTLYGEKQG